MVYSFGTMIRGNRMTKREAIKTILSGHTIHIEFDCDLNEEADENFIRALEQIRDWANRIDKEIKNEHYS